MPQNNRSTGNLIREAWARGDPTGWFERIYAQAASGEASVPWALNQAHPALVSWLGKNPLDSRGKRAMVVGCGLGDDAEYLSKYDFNVTAFDISETAISQCQTRFPGSKVEYVVADLFDLPAPWRMAFDLVLESHTIQTLPHQLTGSAIEAIASLVAAAGTLLLICFGRDPEEDRRGIPWPLSRRELAGFAENGLTEIAFEDYIDGGRRFCVGYRREVPDSGTELD